MNDDADLLRRFAETQDQAAFTDIVRRHIGFVYAVALRRMRVVHSADDVTQAVFVALARKAATVATCPSVIGWLHRSAYFESRNIMRAEINRTSRELEAQRRGHVRSEKSADMNWEAIRAVLDDVLQELPDKDREAVLSRFFAGESYTQVGARLRLSENAARMRVERALVKLHECFIRRGITSTGAALASALPLYASTAVPAGLVASTTNAAMTGITFAAAPVGIFAFMSATKIAIAAGVFGALGIVAALHQANVAQESKSALAAIATERDILRTRLVSTASDRASKESKAGSIPTRNDAAQRMVSSTASEHDVTATAPTKAWQTISPVNQAFESPEARDAFVTQEVLRAEAKFQRFFATAGLSVAQEAALRAQFRSLSETMVDYYRLVRNQGFGPMNPPQNPKVLAELLRMENDVLKGFESGVRGVLGDASYQEFAAYWKTIRERNVSEQLAGRLYYTGTPLTSAQADNLVQILRENRYEPSSTPSPTNTLNGVPFVNSSIGDALGQSNLINGDLMMPAISWSAPVTDAAIARAGMVLSPTQVSALRQLQAEQAARYRLAPSMPKGATTEQALVAVRKAPEK